MRTGDDLAGRRPLDQGRAARNAYLAVEWSEPHANLSFVHSYVTATIRQRKGLFRLEDWPVAVADGTVQRAIDTLDEGLGSAGCSGILATNITSPGISDPPP